jgi:hypothetical protein
MASATACHRCFSCAARVISLWFIAIECNEILPEHHSKKLGLTGFVLFILSFIPGVGAFCVTPVAAVSGFKNFAEFGQWQRAALATTLIIGWLANFSVFCRLPKIPACVALGAPWALYVGQLFLNSSGGVEVPRPDTRVVFFYPFYPWACGFALIQISRLLEPSPKEDPRSPWSEC